MQLLTMTLSIYTLHVDLKYDAIGPLRPLLFFIQTNILSCPISCKCEDSVQLHAKCPNVYALSA